MDIMVESLEKRFLSNQKLYDGLSCKDRLAYKYLLTLSTTQVACERSFSTLSDDNLEALMLMVVNREILVHIDNKDIMNGIRKKSNNLANLLGYK